MFLILSLWLHPLPIAPRPTELANSHHLHRLYNNPHRAIIFVSEKCRQTNKLGPHSASSVGGSEGRAHNLQRDELLAFETQREGGAWGAMDASITSVSVQQEVWLIGSHAITVS